MKWPLKSERKTDCKANRDKLSNKYTTYFSLIIQSADDDTF